MFVVFWIKDKKASILCCCDKLESHPKIQRPFLLALYKAEPDTRAVSPAHQKPSPDPSLPPGHYCLACLHPEGFFTTAHSQRDRAYVPPQGTSAAHRQHSLLPVVLGTSGSSAAARLETPMLGGLKQIK